MIVMTVCGPSGDGSQLWEAWRCSPLAVLVLLFAPHTLSHCRLERIGYADSIQVHTMKQFCLGF